MNKVRYIKFSPDEYISGVGAKLSAEQQGVYWMICSMIYSNGGDIENDPKHIGRMVCYGSSKTKRIVNQLISIGKLIENQSYLSQKRCVTELKTAQNRTETATANGSKPKRNNNLDEADAFGVAELTINHKPLTNNHKPINDKSKPSQKIKDCPVGSLKTSTYETIADIAGGWNVTELETKWRAWSDDMETPRPDGLFIAFVERHIRHNTL